MTENRIKRRIIGDPIVQRRYAEIRGRTSYSRPLRFEDTLTGSAYYYIGGGVAWPTKTDLGFCCVVGVENDSKTGLKFKILCEYESVYFSEIYDRCLDLQNEFQAEGLFQAWWGDEEASETLVSERNWQGDQSRGFVTVASPPDIENSDCFTTYLNRLTDNLSSDHGHKRLWLGEDSIVARRLEAFDVEEGGRLLEKHAAITVVGFMLHALHQFQPWKEAIHTEMFVKPTYEDVATNEPEIDYYPDTDGEPLGGLVETI